MAQLLITLLLCLICWWVSPGQWSALLLGSCLAVVTGYAVYAAAGVALLGIRVRRVGLLVCVPFAVAGYLLIALKSLFRRGTGGWERTPRIEKPRAI